MTQEEQTYLQKFAQEFKNRKGIAPERQHLHYALKKYREEQPSLADVKETGMPEFMQPQPQPAEAVSTAVKPTMKSTEEKKLALEKAWELIGKGWEEVGRPHYAIANVIKFAQDPETYYKTHNIKKDIYSFRAGVGQSFWEGLTKKEKATVSESFNKALTYMPEEWWVLKGTFKTIGDVSDWVTDPRYWLIGKAIGVVAKGAIKAAPEKLQRFLLKPRKLFKGKPTKEGIIRTGKPRREPVFTEEYMKTGTKTKMPRDLGARREKIYQYTLRELIGKEAIVGKTPRWAEVGANRWADFMNKYLGKIDIKIAEMRYVNLKLPKKFIWETPANQDKWVKALETILKNLEKAGAPKSVETLAGAIEQANYFVAPGVAAIVPEEEVIRKPPGVIEKEPVTGAKPLIEEVYPAKKPIGAPVPEAKGITPKEEVTPAKPELELKAKEVKIEKPAPKVTQETITGEAYIPPKKEIPGAEIEPGEMPLFEAAGEEGAEQLRLGGQKKVFNPLTGEEELIIEKEELPTGETKYEAGKYYGAFGEEISKKDYEFLYGSGSGEVSFEEAIREIGGIRSYEKIGGKKEMRSEYLKVPVRLRKKNGLPFDEAADELRSRYAHLNINDESDLIEAFDRLSRRPPRTTADIGGYATSPSGKFALPELTEIASELMGGAYPRIVEHIRAAGGLATGVFRARKGDIKLKAAIFSNLEEAEKTLAHEIGHLVDWLPDKTLKRGNILGRIATLKKYLKTLLEESPDSREHILTPKERSKIRYEAAKRARSEGATGERLKSIAARMYAEMIDEEIVRRGLIVRTEVMNELQVLSQRWKPFDETNEEMIKYRFSPKELYADAISVLLNDPKLLQEVAPIFYKGFFNYLGRKPEVQKVYNEILSLTESEETILAHRQARMRAMFEKGEDIFTTKRNERKKRSIIEALRHAFYNRNIAGETAVEKAIKKGIEVKPEDNPIYAIEEMVYSTSEGEAYMRDVDRIFKNLRNNDLTWEDLGDVLFHERVMTQRAEIANPLGFTPETSERQLKYIQEKTGARKWQVLQNAVKNFRDVRKYVIDRLEESHFVSEDLIKRMRENPHYAHFLVLHYYQDKFGIDLSGWIMPQTGALAEVANTATSTVMKDLAILKDITRQEAAHNLIGIIQQSAPEDIKDPELRFNGKAMVPVRPSRGSDWRLVVYPYNGELQSHYVRPQVAEIFNRSPDMVDKIGKVMSIGNLVFRELYVGINYGFMAFNAIRDFVRLSKTMPGKVVFFNVIKPYIKAIPAAIRRGWGLDDATVQEMLRKKMLITVGGRYSITTEDKQIEWLLKRYEIMGTDKYRNAIIKPFYKLFNGLHNIGQTIEAIPKIAGYRYLTKLGFNEKEVGHMVRTMAGSPDFLRKGRLSGIYNNLLLFSNPMIQGWAGDIEALKLDPVGYAGKSVQVNLIPKILMYLAAIGALGVGIKKIFDGMSEYDKTNYTCIPLGLTASGKSVYLRVPQDEVGRTLSGILWKGLTSRRAQDIQQLGDYTAGQIPSLSPYLGMGLDIAQYVTGKNPYNWFRGRYVMNETVFEAGGWRSHREFLKYLAKQGGVNLVYRFPRDNDVEVKSDLEKILGYPIVSNIVGRFLKVTDYGIREQIDETLQDIRQEKAKEIIGARDAIVKIVKGESERITENEWIALAKHPNLKDRNLEILLTRRYGTTYLDMLKRAKNDEERIAIWKTIMKLEPVHKPEIEKVLQP